MICVRQTEFSDVMPLLLTKYLNQITEMTINFFSAHRTATKMVLGLYTSSCSEKIY